MAVVFGLPFAITLDDPFTYLLCEILQLVSHDLPYRSLNCFSSFSLYSHNSQSQPSPLNQSSLIVVQFPLFYNENIKEQSYFLDKIFFGSFVCEIFELFTMSFYCFCGQKKKPH